MKEFLYKYKSSLFSLFLIVTMMCVHFYRKHQKTKLAEQFEQLQSISGSTMGTTYSIKYIGKKQSLKESVDSLLVSLNNSVSTYIPTSEISEFNQTGKVVFRTKHLYNVLKASKKLHALTNGFFDPTVMPLVNVYGFGYEEKNLPTSSKIDSILLLVGFDKIDFNADSVWNLQPNVQLDMSAIAKGYGVDVVADFLSSKSINNYMVEIGGEVRCSGTGINEKPWTIGVVDPMNPEALKNKVRLTYKSMATSGNYRNFYEENGTTYSHTINPKTGLSERNALLSATVVADDCMTSDALATGFMVLGPDKSIELAKKENTFKVYFIYSENGEIKTFDNL